MSDLSNPAAGESRYSTPGPLRTLRADGLDLRPWQPHQAVALVTIAADELISTWNPISAGDVEQAAAWIDSRRDWTDHATWAILGPQDVIWGSISLFHLDQRNASGEIGYWVAPDVRGQGVAVRALAAVCAFAYGQLDVVRLELFHAVENEESCRVATKSGFAREGTLRKSYRYADGMLHDEHLHARLNTD